MACSLARVYAPPHRPASAFRRRARALGCLFGAAKRFGPSSLGSETSCSLCTGLALESIPRTMQSARSGSRVYLSLPESPSGRPSAHSPADLNAARRQFVVPGRPLRRRVRRCSCQRRRPGERAATVATFTEGQTAGAGVLSLAAGRGLAIGAPFVRSRLVARRSFRPRAARTDDGDHPPPGSPRWCRHQAA
jgi:hypothetical protein